MREIKFRAWEPDTEMGKPGSMSYDQDFCHSQILHNDGIEIMQFTGLKDKNGKDIYEGDVLKENDKLYEVTWDTEYGVWRAFYRKGPSVLCKDMPFALWNYFHIPGSQEYKSRVDVVGNIYENPELLKDKI